MMLSLPHTVSHGGAASAATAKLLDRLDELYASDAMAFAELRNKKALRSGFHWGYIAIRNSGHDYVFSLVNIDEALRVVIDKYAALKLMSVPIKMQDSVALTGTIEHTWTQASPKSDGDFPRVAFKNSSDDSRMTTVMLTAGLITTAPGKFVAAYKATPKSFILSTVVVNEQLVPAVNLGISLESADGSVVSPQFLIPYVAFGNALFEKLFNRCISPHLEDIYKKFVDSGASKKKRFADVVLADPKVRKLLAADDAAEKLAPPAPRAVSR